MGNTLDHGKVVVVHLKRKDIHQTKVGGYVTKPSANGGGNPARIYSSNQSNGCQR
jgi:hypothetical protein